MAYTWRDRNICSADEAITRRLVSIAKQTKPTFCADLAHGPFFSELEDEHAFKQDFLIAVTSLHSGCYFCGQRLSRHFKLSGFYFIAGYDGPLQCPLFTIPD